MKPGTGRRSGRGRARAGEGYQHKTGSLGYERHLRRSAKHGATRRKRACGFHSWNFSDSRDSHHAGSCGKGSGFGKRGASGEKAKPRLSGYYHSFTHIEKNVRRLRITKMLFFSFVQTRYSINFFYANQSNNIKLCHPGLSANDCVTALASRVFQNRCLTKIHPFWRLRLPFLYSQWRIERVSLFCRIYKSKNNSSGHI